MTTFPENHNESRKNENSKEVVDSDDLTNTDFQIRKGSKLASKALGGAQGRQGSDGR